MKRIALKTIEIGIDRISNENIDFAILDLIKSSYSQVISWNILTSRQTCSKPAEIELESLSHDKIEDTKRLTFDVQIDLFMFFR